jgi:hypothetical protein
MKNPILIPMLILILLVLACRDPQPRKSQIDQFYKTPTPTPFVKVYAKPEIGMDLVEFRALCGEMRRDDDLSTLDTAQGHVSTYYLEYTEERGKKDCYGRFSFVDGELTAIAR